MAFCAKCGQAKADMKRCSGCKCAYYCSVACRDEDWPEHKRYCKRLLFVKLDDARDWGLRKRKARPQESELFCTKLAAAKAAGQNEEAYVLMTAMAAEKFVQACDADYLPSCETEERVWGLYGDPRSEPYQRRLLAYQKALKFGDLSAQQLMECLLSRHEVSKALTKALKKVKVVHTESDSLEQTYFVVDRMNMYTDGIEIDSEFDRWPIKEQASA